MWSMLSSAGSMGSSLRRHSPQRTSVSSATVYSYEHDVDSKITEIQSIYSQSTRYPPPTTPKQLTPHHRVCLPSPATPLLLHWLRSHYFTGYAPHYFTGYAPHYFTGYAPHYFTGYAPIISPATPPLFHRLRPHYFTGYAPIISPAKPPLFRRLSPHHFTG
jgi:hypothetical protein